MSRSKYSKENTNSKYKYIYNWIYINHLQFADGKVRDRRSTDVYLLYLYSLSACFLFLFACRFTSLTTLVVSLVLPGVLPKTPVLKITQELRIHLHPEIEVPWILSVLQSRMNYRDNVLVKFESVHKCLM